jgi:hypothetical protein
MPEMPPRSNLEIEFDRRAVGLQVLDHAWQIVLPRPFPDKRRKRSLDGYLKRFVTLK